MVLIAMLGVTLVIIAVINFVQFVNYPKCFAHFVFRSLIKFRAKNQGRGFSSLSELEAT